MAHEIANRAEFLSFLASLRSDLKTKPYGWENRDLPTFLQAMESWVADMDGYYRNIGQEMPPEPTWQMFADILNGARVYE